jgi:hypothetical protein
LWPDPFQVFDRVGQYGCKSGNKKI